MTNDVLENANGKYLYVTITRHEAALCYSNLNGLFEFIAENNGGRRAVYDSLRKKVKSKLGGGKLKLSIREIKAFLKPQNQYSQNPIMKIPYKSYQLMEAFIESVEDLHKHKISLPPDLDHVLGKSYGQAFLKKQIEKCDEKYLRYENEWLVSQPAKYHLHEDFHNIDSPFYKIVK